MKIPTAFLAVEDSREVVAEVRWGNKYRLALAGSQSLIFAASKLIFANP